MHSSYVSLHLSPQVSGSVVYGRSPMVSPQGGKCQEVSAGPKTGGQKERPVTRGETREWGKGGESWVGKCKREDDLRVSVDSSHT